MDFLDPVESLRFRIIVHVESMEMLLRYAVYSLQRGELVFAQGFIDAARISEHEALIKRYKLRELRNRPRVGIKTSQLMYEEPAAHRPLGGLCWCYECTHKLMAEKFPDRLAS